MVKKAKPEVRDIVSILNNPADKKKLTNFIDEALRCKQKVDDENESIKVLREEALDQIGIEGKMFNSLLRLYHTGKFAEKHEEVSQLEMAIEMLTGQHVDNSEE